MDCVRNWNTEGYGHFFECFLLKGKLVDQDSNVDKPLLEALIKKLYAHATPPAPIDETVEKCAVKKATPQESAAALYQCIAKALLYQKD